LQVSREAHATKRDPFWWLALRGEGNYMHSHFVTSDNQLQSRIMDWHGRVSTGIVFRF